MFDGTPLLNSLTNAREEGRVPVMTIIMVKGGDDDYDKVFEPPSVKMMLFFMLSRATRFRANSVIQTIPRSCHIQWSSVSVAFFAAATFTIFLTLCFAIHVFQWSTQLRACFLRSGTPLSARAEAINRGITNVSINRVAFCPTHRRVKRNLRYRCSKKKNSKVGVHMFFVCRSLLVTRMSF